MTRECKQCAKQFEAKRANMYYCSGACRVAMLRKVSVTQSVTVGVTDVTDNSKDVTDNVTDNVTDKPALNNWQKLMRRYPKKITCKEDAIRFAMYSVIRDVPTAVIALGPNVYGRKETKIDLEPPHIGDFGVSSE